MPPSTVKRATESESRALLDGCTRLPGDPKRGVLAKAVLSTFLFSGVRVCELLALEVADCSLLDWRLSVRMGRSNQIRSIPMNTHLHAALEAWLDIRKAPSILPNLFVTRPSRGLSEYSLGTLLHDVRIVAGLRDRDHLQPHAFRRYFAATLQNNGASLANISKLLGHASTTITARHLMTEEQHLKDAVESVSVLGPEPPRLRTVHGRNGERNNTKRAEGGDTDRRRSIRLKTA